MVSFIHEALVTIVREHPTALLDLLRASFGVEHEGALEVLGSPENLTVLQTLERRADIVLVLRDPSTREVRTAFVVEVQAFGPTHAGD